MRLCSFLPISANQAGGLRNVGVGSSNLLFSTITRLDAVAYLS